MLQRCLQISLLSVRRASCTSCVQRAWRAERVSDVKTMGWLMVMLMATGCGATSLKAGARSVMVTRTPAPAGCVYLGSVIGNQGGALAGPYTSNANLAEGALNDMKNKAFDMGANYVVLEDTHAGSTHNKGSGGQTDVTHMGNAFRCPSQPTANSGQSVVVVQR